MAGFENDIVFAKNADFTQSDNQAPSEANGLATNGQLWIGSTAVNLGSTHINVGALTSPNGSITFGYSSPNITAVVNTAVMTDLHVARYIVSAGGATDGANYTTIATAYAAAVLAGGVQTVFVQPGTYTENLTLTPNVNLTAFICDAFSPNVTIIGKITMTAAGTYAVSGIRHQTNGDYAIETTGANLIVSYFINCYLSGANFNCVHCTNASATLRFMQCGGDCSTNTYFVATAGAIKGFFCNFESPNTTTNSTFANANLELDYCYFACPITTSGTGGVGLLSSRIIVLNSTALTHGGSGNSLVIGTQFESGNASAISIGSTLQVIHCSVFSTNANAITGAGTLQYGMIVFYGAASSSTVNTSTQTALATLI